MALIMKTACCGKSLRAVSLFLLCANLILGLWLLWNAIDNTYISFMVFLRIMECFVFLGTIVTIIRKKSPIALLPIVELLLIKEIGVIIFSLIKLNLSEDFEKHYRTVWVEECVGESWFDSEDSEDLGELREWCNDMYLGVVLFVNVLLVIHLILKLYSILVIHSYKAELKRDAEDSLSTQQNAHYIA